ncbi:hypothetical protein DL96DRAFT_1719086 [Flagelloscypha sp. PMI_526]|nr:hypothetical protein DL96DRAFT_1719086 [Flagelloscypha sp. PMI_526]
MTTHGVSVQLDECTHHSSLWFPDGNIVLRAGLVLFKVYKGILAAKCTVFADMLSIPQPAEADTDQPFYGDCPLICLDDEEEEVTAFLILIFDSMSLRNPKWCTFKQALGILRLSHKYDSPLLMNYAVEALDAVVPLTLATFDSTEPPSEFQDSIISLCKLCEDTKSLDWMFPWAAYVAIATVPTSQLSMANINFKEMERLQRFLIFNFISSVSQSSDMCNGQPCHEERFDYISALVQTLATAHLDSILCAVRSHTGEHIQAFITDSPLELHFEFCTSSRICSRCQNAMLDSIQSDREKFWDAIPDALGLISWESLLARRLSWLNKLRNSRKIGM